MRAKRLIPVLLGVACLSGVAIAGDLEFGYVPSPGPGEQPGLLITPPRAVKEIQVSCEAGGKTYDWRQTNLPAGETQRYEWNRNPSVTEAKCHVYAVFADGYVDEAVIPISYQYSSQLSVDLSKASADIDAHTLTVNVTAYVESAEVVAYGAHKSELARQTVSVQSGPGEITIPWVGDASEVVLLDVKVENETAWAGFTFSPWFLDIPHDDVLFDTNSDVILADQEYKLQATLNELNDLLEKYGDVVPVKLYIAGCTDTVGDSGGNKELSRRRARSIAKWLRSNGYTGPIYYYGFGESLLAVSTGDNVDEVRNRRVLYMVGASPPPSGSGVPSVNWIKL